MKNIARDIFFRCKHDIFFFKFCGKLKGTLFYYQNFPDPEFATALLPFTCSRHINKWKYLIFVKLNNISQWKRFLTNFAKIKKASILYQRTQKLKTLRWGYIFMVTFRYWCFITKIGITYWCFSVILHLLLIRVIYLRTTKTK